MKRFIPLDRSLFSITLAILLSNFATALVGVFIPLIILQRGASLVTVAGFYLAYSIIKLVINYPTALIIQRYGAHIGLGLGFVSGALQLAAIFGYSKTQSLPLLIIGAVTLALTNAFIWNSMHLHISRVMEQATKSSSMATMAILSQAMGVIAPIIGGFIGLVFGAGWLLVFALVITLIALLPLRQMGSLEVANIAKTPAAPRLQYTLRGAPSRDLFANFCFNLDTAVGVIVWPIYLAVIIKTFSGIGLISALAAGVTAIVIWWAGRRGDRGHDRAVLQEGVIVSSVVHVLRLFAVTPLTVALVSASYKASLGYMSNAWTSTYYAHAKDRGIAYIMSMEIAGDAAYTALWGIIFAVSYFAGMQAFFITAFALAAAASWGCLLITGSKPGMGQTQS